VNSGASSPPSPPPAPPERLKKRSQFLFVRDGARAARPNVVVEARRRAPEGPIGIGFTASRKVGNAPTRNRARRRLKEAARRLLPELGLPGVDYVMVARQSTPAAGWASLLDDVGNALIRLRADLGQADAPRRSNRPARKRAAPSKPPKSETESP
jgi:ribonuclease P protein component